MAGKNDGPAEADYLTHEAETAKAAIARIRQELTASLKQSADPQAWTREYPMPALGAALAGGFAAGAVAKPMIFGSRKEHDHQEIRSRRKTRRGKAVRAKRSKFAWLMNPVVNMAKVSIKNALIAGITAKAATEAADSNDDEMRGAEAAPEAAASPYAAARTSSQL